MKTNTKNLGKCQVELKVTLDADEMKAVIKDVEKVFLREAQMPGFRKGKVPIELIRKEFAAGEKGIVIKADGLAAGKGVLVADSEQAALDFIDLCFDGGFRRFSLEKYHYIASFNSMGALTTRRFVRQMHAAGREVKIWTVNNPAKVVEGVDGVITNDPRLFL